MASCAKTPREQLQDALESSSDRMRSMIEDKLANGTDDELQCLCSILFVTEHEDKSLIKEKLSIMKSSPFTDKEMRRLYARAVWRGDIDSMRMLSETMEENEEIRHMERVFRASLRILLQKTQRGASLGEREVKVQTNIHKAFQSSPNVSSHGPLFRELIQMFGEASIAEMDRAPLPQWKPASEIEIDKKFDSSLIRVRTKFSAERSPSDEEIRIKISRETLYAFGKSTSTNYVSWLGASAYIERVLKWCLVWNQALVLAADNGDPPKALVFPLGDLDHDDQPLFGVITGHPTEVMAFQFGTAESKEDSLLLRPADMFKAEALPDVDVGSLVVPRMHHIFHSMLQHQRSQHDNSPSDQPITPPNPSDMSFCINACWFNPDVEVVLSDPTFHTSVRLAQSRPWSVSPCLPETGFRENGPLGKSTHPFFLVPIFPPEDEGRFKQSNIPSGALAICYNAENQCYTEVDPGVVINRRNAFLMAKLLTRCPPKWVYTGVYQELREQEETSSG